MGLNGEFKLLSFVSTSEVYTFKDNYFCFLWSKHGLIPEHIYELLLSVDFKTYIKVYCLFISTNNLMQLPLLHSKANGQQWLWCNSTLSCFWPHLVIFERKWHTRLHRVIKHLITNEAKLQVSSAGDSNCTITRPIWWTMSCIISRGDIWDHSPILFVAYLQRVTGWDLDTKLQL